jgi:hypothetical protein
MKIKHSVTISTNTPATMLDAPDLANTFDMSIIPLYIETKIRFEFEHKSQMTMKQNRLFQGS